MNNLHEVGFFTILIGGAGGQGLLRV